ncbi:hypothetical protein NEOLEDRAFT_1132385 [Neolentinus lepideus HHB14362 ss-1]|uniref:Uncharacterized protein n=1 Tax=Neolentinus lepideus HHB14362 ss-1 TaxID=1314782 RepID=A0A165T9E2_9AGAM|nr:hypothetical protein NEOLEDRAFT_1132385 [Neolentinus lepideus HHB14362 ss-1]
MSTVTMTDSYDTQMMDYSGDIDMQMQGSFDGWFNPESTMVEDGIMDDLVDVDHEGVEVDMEADVGESAEFEMIDDVENGPLPDAGLVDVEVYDVSLMASPAIVDSAHVGEAVQGPGTQEQPGMYTESPAIHAVESSLHGQEGQVTHVAQSQSHVPAADYQASGAPASTVDLLQEAPDSAVAHLEALSDSEIAYSAPPSSFVTSADDQQPNDVGGRQDVSEGPGVGTSEQASKDAHASPEEEVPLVHPEDVESFIPLEAVTLDEGRHPPDASPPTAGPVNSSPSKQDEGITPTTLDRQHEPATPPTSGDQLLPVVNVRDVEKKCTAPECESSVLDDSIGLAEGLGSSGGHESKDVQEDPHRISEGVYIDPPPAVLLTLPESSSPSECCLFNQPSSSSGTLSPVEERGSPVPDYLLFLHQRPVLYYESLRDVFDALRREEHLTSLAGAITGELCLEAYDLQLVISEDNVFARDISLHDLNVLHDGFGLAGPLRLRLSFISPRFITRYHELRQQLGQLTVTGDSRDSAQGNDELVVTEESSPVPASHAEVAKVQHTEVPDAGDELEHDQDEGTSPNDDRPEAQDVQDSDNFVDEDAPDDAGDDADEGGDQQAASDVPQVNVDVEGEESEQTDSVSSTTLDADGVHDPPEAEGDGTYDDFEYADVNEDDDERFGEDLSEELGGTGEADDALLPEDNIPLQIGPGDLIEAGEVIELATVVESVPPLEPEGVEGRILAVPEQATDADYSNYQGSLQLAEQGDLTSDQHQVPTGETENDANCFTEPLDDHQEELSNNVSEEDVTYDDDQEQWDDDLTDTDATWDADTESGLVEDDHVVSHKNSKRTFEEVDDDEDSDGKEASPTPSPNSKRMRRD